MVWERGSGWTWLVAGLCAVSPMGCAPAKVVTDEAQDCSPLGRLAFVEDRMLDDYLWADHVVPVAYDASTEPAELIAELRYPELDRWSYVRDLQEADEWFDSGGYVGGGYSLRVDPEGAVRFAVVYPDGPAAEAGIARGDALLAVGGTPIEALTDAATWDAAFGPVEDGAGVVLTVATPGADPRDTTLVYGPVTVPPVMGARTFDLGDRTVAYFMLTSFVDTAHDALDDTFVGFVDAGVDTVVVDLRYNGGGLISVARHLAGLVTMDHVGDVFMTYAHNADHTNRNAETRLEAHPHALRARDVVFLTTGSTGSASEMLMFGLEPYVRVARVGARTAGKPVGMKFFEACDLLVAPITFQTGNREALGTYFDGLAPDCAASDDLLTPLGSTEDPMLRAGLALLSGQACPTEAVAVSRPPTNHLPGARDAWSAVRAGGAR